ncbi:hypothetical protein H632_c36p1 [Helicosporidium sp. ATCC 50920]|nr:hypothetical protein H632_c36p1 [Helicosporidium sp. ATCC 50920]|eukprot:KDD77030.1 hypothetical protein H632_c36p1 [Helicosporidium sp. ATCC 50920]
MNLVESCYLLSHSRDTGFVGVNMYVDDEGSLKNLPPNVRASEIAKLCARPMQVRGDAFLARMLDDGDAFERQDFTLADLSSRAPWLLQARQQNEARQTQETPEAVMRRLQQEAQGKGAPRREIKELTPSEAARAEGNEAAKKGDWKRAHAKYSESIELDRANLLSKNNRALACLRLELFEQAAQDASDVLEQEGDNVKALLRRAAASKGLNKVPEAVADLDRVLELEPKNADAAREKQGLLATEAA